MPRPLSPEAKRIIDKYRDELIKEQKLSVETIDRLVIAPLIKKIEDGFPDLTPIDFSRYNPDEPIPCLVGDPKGEILIAEGELVEIASETGVGKTHLCCSLAVSLLMGAPFLGFPIPRRNLKILYLAADNDSPRLIRKRMARYAASAGITHETLAANTNLRVFCPRDFNLNSGGPDLQLLLADFDPDVVIAETLTTLSLGADLDLKSQDDAATFMARRVRPLQLRSNGRLRTLILTGHFTKWINTNGRASSTKLSEVKSRIAGSFAVTAGLDAAIGLVGLDDRPRSFVFLVAKPSREGAMFTSGVVDIVGERNDPLHLDNVGTLDEVLAQAKRKKQEVADNFLLAEIDEHDSDDEGIVDISKVYKRKGASAASPARRSLQRTISSLLEAGRIEKVGKKRGIYRILPSC